MKDTITFADFMKLDFKIGTITECSKIEKSEKLLKMQIDLGEEKRQIISGIAKWYQPEDLIEKQVIVLTNLEPRKMMGEESRGMLLAVDISPEEVFILSPDQKMPNGATVR